MPTVEWKLRRVERGESERFPAGVPSETVLVALTDAEFAEMRKRTREIAEMPPGEARSAALAAVQVEMELRALLDAKPLSEAEEAKLRPARWQEPRQAREPREEPGSLQTSLLAPEGTVRFPIPEKARRKMGHVEPDNAPRQGKLAAAGERDEEPTTTTEKEKRVAPF